MEILALTPKGYCQFIRGLFILWGSAGREVQVTRRRWGGAPCLGVPHNPARAFSLFYFHRVASPGSVSKHVQPLPAGQCLPTTLMYWKEARTLSGGGEESRKHEGQKPPSDRLINRAPGCMQLTLGMTFGEGGGGVRSVGSCVPCRELAGLRMNRSEILKQGTRLKESWAPSACCSLFVK